MLVLKDVLRPHFKPISSGGGKSSNQTSTLQTESNSYPSHIIKASDEVKKWAILGLFFVYFRSFSNTLYKIFNELM